MIVIRRKKLVFTKFLACAKHCINLFHLPYPLPSSQLFLTFYLEKILDVENLQE